MAGPEGLKISRGWDGVAVLLPYTRIRRVRSSALVPLLNQLPTVFKQSDAFRRSI